MASIATGMTMEASLSDTSSNMASASSSNLPLESQSGLVSSAESPRSHTPDQHHRSTETAQLLSVKRRREAVVCVPDNPRYAPFNYMLSHLLLDDAPDRQDDTGRVAVSPIPSPVSMPHAEKLKYLSSVLNSQSALFAALPKSTQESIITEMHIRRCTAGSVIVPADILCDQFSVVYSGQVGVSKSTSAASSRVTLSPTISAASPTLATESSGTDLDAGNSITTTTGMSTSSTSNDDQDQHSHTLKLEIAPSTGHEDYYGSERAGKRICLDVDAPAIQTQGSNLPSMSRSDDLETSLTPVPTTCTQTTLSPIAYTASGTSTSFTKLLGPGSLISEACLVHPYIPRATFSAHTDVYLFSIDGGLFRFLTSSANKSRYHELRTYLTQLPFLMSALQRQLDRSGSTIASAVNSPSLGPQSGSHSPSIRRSPYRLASPPSALTTTMAYSQTSQVARNAMGANPTSGISGTASAAAGVVLTRRRRSLSPSRTPIVPGTSSDHEVSMGRAPSATALSPATRIQSPTPISDGVSPILSSRGAPPMAPSGDEATISATGTSAAPAAFRRYKVGRQLTANLSGNESAVSSGTCSTQASPELRALPVNTSSLTPVPLCTQPRVSAQASRDLMGGQDDSTTTMPPPPPPTQALSTSLSPQPTIGGEECSSGGDTNSPTLAKACLPRALSWSSSGGGNMSGGEGSRATCGNSTTAQNPGTSEHDSLGMPQLPSGTSRLQSFGVPNEATPRSAKVSGWPSASVTTTASPASKTVLQTTSSGDVFIVPMLPAANLLRLKAVHSTDSQSPITLQRTSSQHSLGNDTPNPQTLNAGPQSKHFSCAQSPRRKGASSPFQQPHFIQTMGQSQNSSRDTSTPVTPTPGAPSVLAHLSSYASHSSQQHFKSELAKVVEVLVESSQISRLELGHPIPENLDCFYIIMKGAVSFPAETIPRSPSSSQRFSFKLTDSADESVAPSTTAATPLYMSPTPVPSNSQVVLHEGQVFFPRASRKASAARCVAPGTVLIVIDADKTYAAMPWLRSEVAERAALDWMVAQNTSLHGTGSGKMTARESRDNAPSPMPATNMPIRVNTTRRTGSLFQREE